jgi:RNA polymerase sigma factor (sigma-70 family)
MNSKGSVMEQTHQERGMNDERSRFPQRAIDPDAALVAQLRGGDTGAAEALVGAFGDRVYRLAMRITGNASDAEEVVQDTLWTASRKINTFRGAAAFSSWVYRITANAAYQKLRGRRSRRNDVSWEDLAPSFDERGQHVEVPVDWSRRLKDPAIEWQHASWEYSTGRKEQAIERLKKSPSPQNNLQLKIWETFKLSVELAQLKQLYESALPSADGLYRTLYAEELLRQG